MRAARECVLGKTQISSPPERHEGLSPHRVTSLAEGQSSILPSPPPSGPGSGAVGVRLPHPWWGDGEDVVTGHGGAVVLREGVCLGGELYCERRCFVIRYIGGRIFGMHWRCIGDVF